jgi:large subunit ribosomal protein L35
MPKMKTKRCAAKRFEITGSGRLKHKKSFRRHLLVAKASKRTRALAGNFVTEKANLKILRRLLGTSIKPPKA